MLLLDRFLSDISSPTFLIVESTDEVNVGVGLLWVSTSQNDVTNR